MLNGYWGSFMLHEPYSQSVILVIDGLKKLDHVLTVKIFWMNERPETRKLVSLCWVHG